MHPPPTPSPSPSCPFCAIASSYEPSPASSLPPSKESKKYDNDTSAQTLLHRQGPQSHVILSTEHVLAFLDIMPLTRGHVLVVPRRHYTNLGEMGVRDGQELGKWLPVLSRVVLKTVLGVEPDEQGQDPRHWNVVQNNGMRAAQTVPHVHFHIIPRPPLNASKTPQTGGWLMFGRGQRDDLDDDEAEELVRQLRVVLVEEVSRIKEEEGIDLDTDGCLEHVSRGKRLERL